MYILMLQSPPLHNVCSVYCYSNANDCNVLWRYVYVVEHCWSGHYWVRLKCPVK